MFFRILKKDLKRKKGINFILFLFMILATVFVASSVNNILVVSNATDYCMEKGKVPDQYIQVSEKEGQPHISDWLDGEGKKYISKYSKEENIELRSDNIKAFKGKDGKDYAIKNTIMLQKQWSNNMLIYNQDQKLMKLKDGEISMQQNEMDQNNLHVGDSIVLKFGELEKTFIIKEAMKDPAFGGDFIGITRYLVSDSDYDEIAATDTDITYNYCIYSDETKELMEQMGKQNFDIQVSVDGDLFGFAYIMSMVTAAVLIIVGVCLIIISFLILRFTIVFTLQEDYKEIGIMKAIGIKNFMIKKIYLVKYFALITFAAAIGCMLSIPASDFMLKSVAKKMMTEGGAANIGINILCSILVMIVVVLLCYLCTNKLRKFSAIEAIRSGETGERFKKKSKISLSKRKGLRPTIFMAVNDILSNLKRYSVLILTFLIGTVVIILPLNTITTMKSKEMVKNFALDPDADFYISPDCIKKEIDNTNDKAQVQKNINKIQKDIEDQGYEVNIQGAVYYNLSWYLKGSNEISQSTTFQELQENNHYVHYQRGVAPEQENEIAMSENMMKDMKVHIGDSVYTKVKNVEKEFIITGTYQNFQNLGKSIVLNPRIDFEDKDISFAWYYQGFFTDNHSKASLDQLGDQLPQYKFSTAYDVLNDQLGDSLSDINTVKLLIVFIICIVNVLITILMMKIFIIGEKGQIALLRSIGFSVKSIRIWQTVRIGIVVLIAEVLGIGLSTLLNNITIAKLFAMMGATHIKIQINPLEVYLIYPLILLTVICGSALISSRAVRKLDIMEINNAE